MTENHKDATIDTIQDKARLMPVQFPIKSETPYERDVKNFIEIERKKFKKTDDLNDLLNKD